MQHMDAITPATYVVEWPNDFAGNHCCASKYSHGSDVLASAAKATRSDASEVAGCDQYGQLKSCHSEHSKPHMWEWCESRLTIEVNARANDIVRQKSRFTRSDRIASSNFEAYDQHFDNINHFWQSQ